MARTIGSVPRVQSGPVLDSGVHRADRARGFVGTPPSRTPWIRTSGHLHFALDGRHQRDHVGGREVPLDPVLRTAPRVPLPRPGPTRTLVVMARPLVRGGLLLLLVPPH